MVSVRPMLTALGVALFVLGLFELDGLRWVAWCDIVIGVLAVVEANLVEVRFGEGERPHGAALVGPAVLGVASFVVGAVGLAAGASVYRGGLTILGGVAFLLAGRARYEGWPMRV
jgi:hypothetical protein